MTMPSEQEHAVTSEFQQLSTLLEEYPQTLATGNKEIETAALDAAKFVFDISVQSEAISQPHIIGLLSSLAPSQAPQTRSKAKAAAEKSTLTEAQMNLFEYTPLKSLFVDGMDDEQIWEQLDLRTKTICRMLDFVLEGEIEEKDDIEGHSSEDEGDDDQVEDDEKLRQALEALQNGEDIDLEALIAEHGLEGVFDEGMGSSDDSEDKDEMSASEENGGEEEEEEEEGISPLRDSEAEAAASSSSLVHRLSNRKKKGRHNVTSELDDGFFDLAEFNAETERAESKSSSRGRLAAGDDSDEEDMDVDLFASVDVNGDMEDDAEGEGETLFYRDFFEAPSRPSQNSPTKVKKQSQTGQVRFHDEVRVKKIKATGKNRSLHADEDDEDEDEDEEDEDEDDDDMAFDDEGESSEEVSEEGEEEHWDIEGSESDSEDDSKEANGSQAMQRLKQDLFADDEEDASEDTTTYQRRMSALKEQIAELESENVAPKEWVLMGEAGSRQRPQNSLLEEDLEFERVMKPVPVTTEESVRTLEETIKARILEGRFDDVVRIRPLEDKPFLPSKFFELKGTKSSQSLAQIYEKDYVASQEGTAVDDRDGKLKKEHNEINAIWENICSKLDALCNAHFVPKQPKAIISTVSNTATATLESALPTTQSTSTMLAPEEVFAASSSALRARSELTPLEKRALRTKERKIKKRQRDALEKSVDKFAKGKGVGSVKKQKQAALDSIVKHGKGVTVVGKKDSTKSKDKRKNA